MFDQGNEFILPRFSFWWQTIYLSFFCSFALSVWFFLSLCFFLNIPIFTFISTFIATISENILPKKWSLFMTSLFSSCLVMFREFIQYRNKLGKTEFYSSVCFCFFLSFSSFVLGFLVCYSWWAAIISIASFSGPFIVIMHCFVLLSRVSAVFFTQLVLSHFELLEPRCFSFWLCSERAIDTSWWIQRWFDD